MREILFVNGWFAQDGVRISGNPESVNPVLYFGEAQPWYPFYGMISVERSPSGWEKFTGEIKDRCGTATIIGEFTHPDVVQFTKKYDHRPDQIFHSLRRVHEKQKLWTGGYNGDRVGNGTTRLIFTKVPDDFFT